MKLKGGYVFLAIAAIFVVGFGAGRGTKTRSVDPEVLAATTTRTVEQRLSSLESRVYLLEKNAGLIKTASTTSSGKEQFVSLTGGSINSADWTKVGGSEFSLDTSLYGKQVEVYLQGWIDGGYGSVRVYDNSNHRVVDQSEVKVDSGMKSSFYTKALSIWRGKNDYYLEARNARGEMTISEPKLKIVVR